MTQPNNYPHLVTWFEIPAAELDRAAKFYSDVLGVSMKVEQIGPAAHIRGDWAAANAQFRAFIESLFDEIARHYGCPAATATSGQRRTWLAQTDPPFSSQA